MSLKWSTTASFRHRAAYLECFMELFATDEKTAKVMEGFRKSSHLIRDADL